MQALPASLAGRKQPKKNSVPSRDQMPPICLQLCMLVKFFEAAAVDVPFEDELLLQAVINSAMSKIMKNVFIGVLVRR